MAKPIVGGIPQQLKRGKNQKFYLYGDHIEEDFDVKLTGATEDVLWQGKVKKKKNGIWIARVDYVGKGPNDTGDLELVDVTVTNPNTTPPEDSDPYPTGVIPDLPDLP